MIHLGLWQSRCAGVHTDSAQVIEDGARVRKPSKIILTLEAMFPMPRMPKRLAKVFTWRALARLSGLEFAPA